MFCETKSISLPHGEKRTRRNEQCPCICCSRHCIWSCTYRNLKVAWVTIQMLWIPVSPLCALPDHWLHVCDCPKGAYPLFSLCIYAISFRKIRKVFERTEDCLKICQKVWGAPGEFPCPLLRFQCILLLLFWLLSMGWWADPLVGAKGSSDKQKNK